MNIYDQYPEMHYYRGKNYRPGADNALLVIGESNYLADEDENTQHLDPEVWYKGNSSTLNDEAKLWINSAQIIINERDKGSNGFTNRAHSIYREGFKKINEYGPKYPDYRQVIDDVVFYNFFLRPAKEGKSIKESLSAIDITIAQEHLARLIKELQPKAILFLSSLAFNHRGDIPQDIICGRAPHPGSQWWNRQTGAYGHDNLPGHVAVKDVVEKLRWS